MIITATIYVKIIGTAYVKITVTVYIKIKRRQIDY